MENTEIQSEESSIGNENNQLNNTDTPGETNQTTSEARGPFQSFGYFVEDRGEYRKKQSSSCASRNFKTETEIQSKETANGNTYNQTNKNTEGTRNQTPSEALGQFERFGHFVEDQHECRKKQFSPCSPMIYKYSNAYLEYLAALKKSNPEKFTHIAALPETVLLKIFSYMTEEQICNMAGVCQEWRRVAYDSSLWREVDLRRFNSLLDENALARLIRTRMTPLLYKINLGGLSLTPRVFQVLASDCPKLRILSLESVTFLEKFSSSKKTFPSGLGTLDLRHSSGDTSAFTAIAKTLHGIEHLGISDQFITSLLFANEFDPLMVKLWNIRVLEFSYCTALTDSMLGFFVVRCPLLESLCLRRCNTIHGSSLSVLIDACPCLTSLVLDGTAITDTVLRVTDWSKSSITELDLSWCRHLSQEGLKAILSRLPKLRYLRLCCVGYGHGVTDEVLDSMVEVGTYDDLQIIDASYSSLITDEGLSRFIEACRGLLYLRINHCRSTTPRLMDLLPGDSKVFVVANFPIDSDVSFNRELLKYTYWPTPVYMRTFGLDVQMGWK